MKMGKWANPGNVVIFLAFGLSPSDCQAQIYEKKIQIH
jgi:hypothetical protein